MPTDKPPIPDRPIEGWMTYDEAAAVLGLSRDTVRRYVERGFLVKEYYGSLPLVSEESVRWYQEHRKPPGNPNFSD